MAQHLEEPSSPPDAHVLIILSRDHDHAMQQANWLASATAAIRDERARDTGRSAPVHVPETEKRKVGSPALVSNPASSSAFPTPSFQRRMNSGMEHLHEYRPRR